MGKKTDAIKMCCWCVFASLIPAGPLEKKTKKLWQFCSQLQQKTVSESIKFNNRAPLFHLVVRFNNFGSGLFGFVSFLLQSSLPFSSISLPGALDRWALGGVFHLMAHTVCWITPPITTLRTLLARRAWDPGNTLLTNWTRRSHLTIAWGTWHAWKK